MADLDRKEIPKLLPEILKGHGEIFSRPENYDPSKPNFYIIPVAHHKKTGDNYAQKIQRQSLEIFHDLYRLGTKKQFLEGVGDGVRLDDPTIREKPVDALPEYKRTGIINRANVAIEGIYGANIDSVGVENLDYSLALRQKFQLAERQFSQVALQVVEQAVTYFKIDFQKKNFYQIRGYTQQIVEKIREKIKTIPESEREKLIDSLVTHNAQYQELLAVFVEFRMDKISGRNKQFAKVVEADGKNDAAFIVGANHSLGVKELLDGKYNVFIVKPDGLSTEAITDFADRGFTEQDFRKILTRKDLYLFGLSEKR